MTSQQSWTSWLLGAYASAVSPTASESTTEDDSAGKDHNSSANGKAPQSSTSPYGPYVRTGRGGAGNFAWNVPQTLPNPDSNLEAQNPSTLNERRRAAANVEHLETSDAVKTKATQRPSSQYIRVGRGYVQSNQVQQSPTTTGPSIQSPTSATASSNLVAHHGRGGAGNYAVAAALNEKVADGKNQKEQLEADERRDKIEEEVQSKLPTPPDAWLGGRRRSSDLPERAVQF